MFRHLRQYETKPMCLRGGYTDFSDVGQGTRPAAGSPPASRRRGEGPPQRMCPTSDSFDLNTRWYWRSGVLSFSDSRSRLAASFAGIGQHGLPASLLDAALLIYPLARHDLSRHLQPGRGFRAHRAEELSREVYDFLLPLRVQRLKRRDAGR